LDIVKRLFQSAKNTDTYLPFIGSVMGFLEPSFAALWLRSSLRHVSRTTDNQE
jgi:hypothetical protein